MERNKFVGRSVHHVYFVSISAVPADIASSDAGR